jgi:phosphoserine phosphatase RsbU/P
MTSQERYRILIVDDDAVNRRVISMLLKKEGYDTIEATNGEECIQMALAKDPALILLDIRMPREDGFSILKRLKSYGLVKNMPVIFMTAVDDVDMKVHGFNLGAVDFIVKGCPKDEVLARVRVHIKQYATLLALAEAQIRMRNQINEAQNTLLVKPQDLPDRNFSILYRSLNPAGGDMYDVIPIHDHLTGYFVCDFAGHSTATGFLTSQMKTLLKQNCIAAFDPVESMIIMNKVLKDTLRPGQYATATYAVLDGFRRKLTVVNMGHPPALFVSLSGEARFMAPGGDILGGFDDVSFITEVVELTPGDRFVLYTDGLVEKYGSSVWSAEINRLIIMKDVIRMEKRSEIPRKVFDCFFTGDQQPADDVLVMVVEYAPRQAVDDVKKTYGRTFRSDLKMVDVIVGECIAYVFEAGGKLDEYGLRVVLYEILVNAVEHGNRKDLNKKVTVSVETSAEVVKIIVEDEGDGFDWKTIMSRSDFSVNAISGRGLPLLKLYGYSWKYNEKGNRIEVIKKFEPTSKMPSEAQKRNAGNE